MQYFQGFLLTGLLRSLSTIFSALFISFHVVVLTVFDMACLDTLKCLAAWVCVAFTFVSR